MPIVGLSRIYVGAHLPYDVAGGAGLGLAVEAAVVGFPSNRGDSVIRILFLLPVLP